MTHVLAAGASPLKWEKATVSGSSPSPRNAHSSCAFGEQMLVFGGSSPSDGPMGDLHSLDVTGALGGGRGHQHAAATCCETQMVRRVMDLIAGPDWSNLKWSVPATTGAAPSKREMHIGFVRPASEGEREILRGVPPRGSVKATPVPRLTPSSRVTSSCDCGGITPAKGGAGDNLLVIVGGRSETGVAADAHVLNLGAWRVSRGRSAYCECAKGQRA